MNENYRFIHTVVQNTMMTTEQWKIQAMNYMDFLYLYEKMLNKR